jgi:hypothetical protein
MTLCDKLGLDEGVRTVPKTSGIVLDLLLVAIVSIGCKFSALLGAKAGSPATKHHVGWTLA